MAELGYFWLWPPADLPLNAQVFHTSHLCAKTQALVQKPKKKKARPEENRRTVRFTWDVGINAVL